VDHVVVVVTRWYGGTNLGVGGLVRAYGGAAAECLRTAARRPVKRIATKPTKASRVRRLDAKSHRSTTKKLRTAKPRLDD
jgi:putative IMPACT (imprinted ancient) family translation regulator